MPGWWRTGLAALCILSFASMAAAQERRIVLASTPGLLESGVFKYLLPRFSLKTRIRVTAVELLDGVEADVLLGPAEAIGEGRPAFRAGKALHLVRAVADGPGEARHAERFVAWLLSRVGQRTVESFRANGRQVYLAAAAAKVQKPRARPTGDLARGEKLSFLHCGRCHVIGPRNRMGGLGSTPSFAVLKTLNDWEVRFRGFYMLNPHPSFTQIPDVTDPFDESRPPPIVPLEITLEDLDAILAYVATIEPAELRGARRR
ncbi:MAG: hypothetical protein OXC28_23455 [Defluviicoccus sp.]|nr:hypothetical protein [Defluviicoccus sp.]